MVFDGCFGRVTTLSVDEDEMWDNRSADDSRDEEVRRHKCWDSGRSAG